MDSSTRQICANGLNFDSVSLEMYASRIFFVWSEGGPRVVGGWTNLLCNGQKGTSVLTCLQSSILLKTLKSGIIVFIILVRHAE